MKKISLIVGFTAFAMLVWLVTFARSAPSATDDPPDPLTGTYAGTVVITSPLGLDPFDMAIVLTDTNGSLSGYIDSDRLLVYPITQITPTIQGPPVSGIRSGSSFTLQTAVFTDTIGTLHRQIVVHTGIISDTGEILTGVYSETLWGLTPEPLTMIGGFSLTRPSNLPPAGVPVELHVRSAPIHIEPQGVATITALLVDFYSEPISLTVISFSASGGSLDPITATTDSLGEALVTFTAPAGTGPITVTATTGTITGTTTLYSYIPVRNYIYLPMIIRQ